MQAIILTGLLCSPSHASFTSGFATALLMPPTMRAYGFACAPNNESLLAGY